MTTISMRLVIIASLLFVTVKNNAGEQGVQSQNAAIAQLLQSKNLSDIVAPLIAARAKRELEESKKDKARSRYTYCSSSMPWHAVSDSCEHSSAFYPERSYGGSASRSWFACGGD